MGIKLNNYGMYFVVLINLDYVLNWVWKCVVYVFIFNVKMIISVLEIDGDL